MKKDEDLIPQINQRYGYYMDRYNPFISRAQEDTKYYRGEQWDAEEKKKVEDAGRPALTKNRIKQKVNLLKGYQARTRFYFKVVSADGAPLEYDEIVREINTELKKIENENDAEYELSDCFADGIVTGISYLEAYIDEDETTLPVKRQIMFRQQKHTNCFSDPDSEMYDLSDSMDFFKIEKHSLDSLKIMFPGKDEEIDKLMPEQDYLAEIDEGVEKRDYPTQDEKGGSRTYDAKGKRPYTLKEYEYWDMVKVKLLVTNMMSEPVVLDHKPEIIQKIEERHKAQAAADPNYKYKILTVQRKKYYVAHFVSGVILKHEPLNIDEFPQSPYFPDRIKGMRDIEDRNIGVVRDLKDPQVEYNKLSSQALANVNSTVNSGIWAEEGALKDPEKVKKYGSAPGFIGWIKKGFWGKWQKETPAQLPAAQLTMAQQAAKEMEEISNIRPDLMGAEEGDKSGRAIALTQQQGFMGINFYFDNFRRTKHLLCRKIVKYICFLRGWDFNNLKIVIDDTAESPTMKYANFLETKELFESGALDSPYGDLIIEAMNISNRDGFKERWEQIVGARLAQEMQQGQIDQNSPEAIQAAEQAAVQDAQAELGGQVGQG